ncbi:MAG: four helix bundle protein, partial [Deltaproteobacteria bacterium]|nr:four helix bundle protein [Deltaproteobacteria bacterium]
MFNNYRELKVWQRSYQLCLEIYNITKRVPNEGRYGLTKNRRYHTKFIRLIKPGPQGLRLVAYASESQVRERRLCRSVVLNGVL